MQAVSAHEDGVVFTIWFKLTIWGEIKAYAESQYDRREIIWKFQNGLYGGTYIHPIASRSRRICDPISDWLYSFIDDKVTNNKIIDDPHPADVMSLHTSKAD
jgi:hypothetical protein